MAASTNTTDEFKARQKETLGAKNEVLEAMKMAEEAVRKKQADADALAKAAREDEHKARAHELWFGKEGGSQGRNNVTSLAAVLKEPTKGYDNFVALYGQIIEFALVLNAALSEDIRPGTRLVNLAGAIGSVAWTLTEKVASGVLQPTATAEQLADGIRAFDRKWLHTESGKGATLKLPDSMIQSSNCDNTGKLTFDSLKDEFPLGTQPELLTMLETVNQSMVKAFLVSKGYSADDATPDVFTKTNSAGVSTPLDSTTFDNLKNDPTDGLAVFAAKSQGIKLTDQPVTFEGGTPESPTPFKTRP
jgi:hypothetical protein